MNCIVTAGPTYEPLDQVRRLTNLSTGKLGTELAAFLTTQGHRVTLLMGEHATYRGIRLAETVEMFGTTADLNARLEKRASDDIAAVFHAAAVSDFAFAKVWRRSEDGRLTEARAGKLSTREGNVLVELAPTPKIIVGLRKMFPDALLVGWKFEVEGDRTDALEQAKRQIVDSRTDACVANGPAYGKGFGIVTSEGSFNHFEESPALFEGLGRLIKP
jgi:phosphopantothenoylcysteine decarboxylase/phosphopantothenate--cysteine ligase